jgi:integrase
VTSVTDETADERRTRRENGDCTAYFNKRREVWYGQWSRPDGSRGTTPGKPTENDALRAARDLKFQEQHGLRSRQQNHRRMVAEALKAWADEIGSLTEATTYNDYLCHVAKLTEDFKCIHLDDLDKQHCQHYANSLRKTLRYGTVRKRMTVLSMALNTAVDWGWIRANPAQGLRIKKDDDPTDVDGLTNAESDSLLEAAAGRSMEWLLTVGLWTGLRKGELLGLRWRDVAVQQLHIRQTLVWRSGCPDPKTGKPWFFKPRPKTRAGRRNLPILPVVAEALQRQRDRVAGLRERACELWTDYDLVFPNEIGGPIEPTTVNREIGKLEAIAKVEHHRIHDWRHTAATKMRTAGVPDGIVMDVCGRTDRAMLGRRQHMTDEDAEEVIKRMVARYPKAAGDGRPVELHATRSKYAGRPHSRRKGARLVADAT